MYFRHVLLALLFSALLPPSTARGQWQLDGVPLSTVAYDQVSPMIASDGSGGAIVTWYDYRSGDYDIYVQRIDEFGVVRWTPNGVALCTATNYQQYPTIVSDGSGGAIVTWTDERDGYADIYAQRVDAFGAAQWQPNGVPLSTAMYTQDGPTIISDGSGGAIVAWHDYRGTGTSDIYAQRVDESGVVQWTADGVALCTAAGLQWYPAIVSDGSGGAIVTWSDYRSVTLDNADIYARRVDASGVPQWTANGVALCNAVDRQESPTITSDESGGAIVTWSDYRSGVGSADIYARRVDASGVAQWTADGVALCTAARFQFSPVAVSDGSGGAIVAWGDFRTEITDIYARRVDASGVAQWTANGVALCTALGDQVDPKIVSDGSGGAIVTWQDDRGDPPAGIYARRIDASGVAQWSLNGVALCSVFGKQYYPTIVSDGSGGAIVAWSDERGGVSADIYARRVYASGDLPTLIEGPTRGSALIASEIYPNPFSGMASMDVQLKTPSAARIEVFDVSGRVVRVVTLRDALGLRRVEFDGRDSAGALLPSGVYFCRVESGGESVTRKMVIAR